LTLIHRAILLLLLTGARKENDWRLANASVHPADRSKLRLCPSASRNHVLDCRNDVVIKRDHDPDPASAVNLTGQKTGADQLLASFAGEPKGTSPSRQFVRSIAIAEDEVESSLRNSAPLGLALCVR
jgi:hypothetical protein